MSVTRISARAAEALSLTDGYRFAVACFEHVLAAAERAEPLPVDLVATVIEPARRFAREVIQSDDDSRSPRPDTAGALDSLWSSLVDELRVDAQHVAEAAVLLTKVSGRWSAQELERFLSHLDAYIDAVDPEGERGVAEETEWRARLLAEIHGQSGSEGTALGPWIEDRLGWSLRYETDWRR